jgi:drug/metabolite transporter (DMT)-like permease
LSGGQSASRDIFLVALGAAGYGAITVGGRLFAQRGFSLFEIALTGALFGALALLPWMIARSELRPQRRDADIFIAYGLAGATLQLSQFAGIVLGVPIAVVALLLYTQPVWTVILGRLLLQEPITRHKLVALAIAATGMVILIGPASLAGGPSVLGLWTSMLAGAMLSIWVILARLSALRGNHPFTTSFGYHGGTTIVLLAAWVLFGEQAGAMGRLDPSVYRAHWALIVGYTIFANIGPNLLVMQGMRGVDASTAGILLLLEPVAAGALAWLIFGESVAGNVWLGGGLILAANFSLVRRARGGG